MYRVPDIGMLDSFMLVQGPVALNVELLSCAKAR